MQTTAERDDGAHGGRGELTCRPGEQDDRHVGDGGDGERERDHPERGEVGEPALEDQWPDRVADRDQADLRDRQQARAADVDPDDRRHPDDPSSRPIPRWRSRRSRWLVPSASTVATSGTAAISSPVSELEIRVSAAPSRTHGRAISMPANARSAGQATRTGRSSRRQAAMGSRSRVAIAVRAEHHQRGADVVDGDLDQEVRNPPDHAHGSEQHQAAPRHSSTLRAECQAAPERFLLAPISRGNRPGPPRLRCAGGSRRVTIDTASSGSSVMKRSSSSSGETRPADRSSSPTHPTRPPQNAPVDRGRRGNAPPCRSGSASATRTARPACRSRRGRSRTPRRPSRTSSCARRSAGT